MAYIKCMIRRQAHYETNRTVKYLTIRILRYKSPGRVEFSKGEYRGVNQRRYRTERKVRGKGKA